MPREGGCTAVTLKVVAGLVMVELAGLLGEWVEKVGLEAGSILDDDEKGVSTG